MDLNYLFIYYYFINYLFYSGACHVKVLIKCWINIHFKLYKNSSAAYILFTLR